MKGELSTGKAERHVKGQLENKRCTMYFAGEGSRVH
jgi:hypothetical protein